MEAPEVARGSYLGENEGVNVVNIFPQVDLLNNTDLVIENTTEETDLFSYTIPAGHLDGDHGLRFKSEPVPE